MRLVVTRPEPDASRTAEALRRLGHQPIVSPMLDVVHDGAASLPGGPFQAVVFTSRNAVRAYLARPERDRVVSMPVLAVGDETALEARRAGFAATRSAGGNLDDLVQLAARELDPGAGPILYVAGEDQAGDPAGRLQGLGFVVKMAVLYRVVARAALTPAAAEALRDAAEAGVLLYSRRSARAFADAVQAAGLAPLSQRTASFCLSDVIAEAIRPVTDGAVLIAARPDQLSLFALVENAADGKIDTREP